jgi:hypothetical protein
MGWAVCEKCGRDNCLGDQLPSCLNLQVTRLTKERDEARQAARDYRRGVTRFLSTGFRLPEYVGVDDGELVAKHPWLKERP